MKLVIDIAGNPPSAQEIEQAKAALKCRFMMMGAAFPVSLTGLALAQNAYAAIGCVALLFLSIMYLLSLTNENETRIFETISPDQSVIVLEWANRNPSVAAYSTKVLAQNRQITDREFAAMSAFLK